MNWARAFPNGRWDRALVWAGTAAMTEPASPCRHGDFRNCQNLKIPGISYDGGYQEYMVAPAEALVAIPETLSAAEAAPLLCAGITTYNALGTAARSQATW
jgi:D-arabinose 1-dehydrogenase-like Zn-dependent alcohol dehydrogenase